MGPTLGRGVAASAGLCMEEGPLLEQEISSRDDSGEKTFFPMEKCITNVKERH